MPVMPTKDEKVVKPVVPMQNVASSFVTGAVTGVVFHPWDKALNLSMVHDRPFFNLKNFVHPMEGIGQTLFQRTFLSAAYFGMQGAMKDRLYPVLREKMQWSEAAAQFGVGTAAGVGYALTNNWASAIKYNMWGEEHTSTFVGKAREMWRKGGAKPFMRGTQATIFRDLKYGGVYELVRQWCRANFAEALPDTNKDMLNFAADMIAAGPASVISGPMNFVRNVQYREALAETPPGIVDVCKRVAAESKELSAREKVGFFARRLKFGPGTARVMVGMAAGQFVFDKVKSTLSDDDDVDGARLTK